MRDPAMVTVFVFQCYISDIVVWCKSKHEHMSFAQCIDVHFPGNVPLWKKHCGRGPYFRNYVKAMCKHQMEVYQAGSESWHYFLPCPSIHPKNCEWHLQPIGHRTAARYACRHFFCDFQIWSFWFSLQLEVFIHQKKPMMSVFFEGTWGWKMHSVSRNKHTVHSKHWDEQKAAVFPSTRWQEIKQLDASVILPCCTCAVYSRLQFVRVRVTPAPG